MMRQQNDRLDPMPGEWRRHRVMPQGTRGGPPAPARAGFSLIEICIVLGIIAVVVASGSTIFSASLQQREFNETQAKMTAIQRALLNFRMANNRIPCPADATQAVGATSGNYFGIEAATPGACTGGNPAANFTATTTATGNTALASATISSMSSVSGLSAGMSITGTNIPASSVIASVGVTTITISQNATATGGVTFTFTSNVQGMVPTKTLGLSDDYAFDGWGRRIMYAVDMRFTAASAFTTIPATDSTPRMTVNDSSGNAKTTTAAYVLLSMGPNGHGALPRGSGTANLNIAASRINVGSVNTDEQNNCDCSSSAAATGLDGVFVQKTATQDSTTPNHTNDFDDAVAFGTRSDLRSPLE
jgi:prepilin-type N-terminal cleavage/methylation domain-containing protein